MIHSKLQELTFKFGVYRMIWSSFPIFANWAKLIAFPESRDWPRGYKNFFMLNSVEHEILNTHKYKDIKKFGFV